MNCHQSPLETSYSGIPLVPEVQVLSSSSNAVKDNIQTHEPSQIIVCGCGCVCGTPGKGALCEQVILEEIGVLLGHVDVLKETQLNVT